MKYFAIIDKKQIGPCSIDELAEAGMHPDTYVWCKGQDDWTEARNVADICRYFRQRLFDKMHPTAATVSPSVPQPQEPASVEELRRMKMRDAWREIGRQIQEGQPDEKELESQPPVSWWPFPIILAIIMFFPLGIPAAIYARKADKMWKEGEASESHECARRSKMYGGIAIAMGFFILGAMIHLLLR